MWHNPCIIVGSTEKHHCKSRAVNDAAPNREDLMNKPIANTLAVRGLTHSYGATTAVDDVSFTVPAGEIAALLGPSGCGKSTVLRAIAGLIVPRSGSIQLGETDLASLPARERGIGMVFQNYALFPHLTVAENIAYPLACQHVPREERRERVAEMLDLVQLGDFGRRLPRELSGGQQQRVAVARALAPKPSLLLLDEPFGALDRALRFDLQVEMLRLQKTLGITTLIVTHDQEEAQSLASSLVLMNRGRIEQIGTPMAVYDQPQTLFVNRFIGQANQLEAAVEALEQDATTLRLRSGETLSLPRRLDFVTGAAVVATCRPEDVSLVEAPAANTLAATVGLSVPLGPNLVHDLVLTGGGELRASQSRGPETRIPAPGATVFASIDTARCHVFPAQAGISAA